MPQFDQSVGKMGRNLVHDVASLQAAFLLLKQHKRIDLWSGPVDGDWNRHKQSLEAAITALEKQLNHSGGIGRIDPRSPLANKLKQMLPMQYQSLAGIKNTACLIIAEPYARRHDGPQVKDMALPERCQQDLERLIKDGSRNLGLELVVDTAKTDHTGRCVITLKPHGVKCLDDRLKPLQPHQPTPKPIKDAMNRIGGSLSQLQPNPHAKDIEVKTREAVLSPERNAQSESERSANYNKAVKVVDEMIAKGQLRKPVLDYILISVSYKDETGYNARGKVILGHHTFDNNDALNRGSIVIFKDGAQSLKKAIETYAHELAHFNQEWNKLYEEDEPHRLHDKYGDDAYQAYLRYYHNR